MEGPISFCWYKEQESNLILPEHDDDDDDNDICIPHGVYRKKITFQPVDRELDKMRI